MKDFQDMSKGELQSVLALTEALAERAVFAQNRSRGDFSDEDDAEP